MSFEIELRSFRDIAELSYKSSDVLCEIFENSFRLGDYLWKKKQEYGILSAKDLEFAEQVLELLDDLGEEVKEEEATDWAINAGLKAAIQDEDDLDYIIQIILKEESSDTPIELSEDDDDIVLTPDTLYDFIEDLRERGVM